MNTTTIRPTIAAALAAVALAVVPVSAAADGEAKPMSSAEAYALTCGHLGVPCSPPHARHRARDRHHARGAARRRR